VERLRHVFASLGMPLVRTAQKKGGRKIITEWEVKSGVRTACYGVHQEKGDLVLSMSRVDYGVMLMSPGVPPGKPAIYLETARPVSTGGCQDPWRSGGRDLRLPIGR